MPPPIQASNPPSINHNDRIEQAVINSYPREFPPRKTLSLPASFRLPSCFSSADKTNIHSRKKLKSNIGRPYHPEFIGYHNNTVSIPEKLKKLEGLNISIENNFAIIQEKFKKEFKEIEKYINQDALPFTLEELEKHFKIIDQELFFFIKTFKNKIKEMGNNTERQPLPSAFKRVGEYSEKMNRYLQKMEEYLEGMQKKYENFCETKEEFSQRLESLKTFNPISTKQESTVSDWHQEADDLAKKGEYLANFWKDVDLSKNK